MKTTMILAKVDFLRGRINPDTVDGNPGQPGPIFRTAISDYIVAGLLRDISRQLSQREIANSIHGIGKELASGASQGLVAGWDEGDDICPPWLVIPRPHGGELEPSPSPWLSFVLEPNPSPWLLDRPAMNDIVLALGLRQLASLTTSEKASAAIKQAGEAIIKAASSRLFDEYCEIPVKPHIQPKRALTAA